MSQKTITCPCCGQPIIPTGLMLPRVKARIYDIVRRLPGISAEQLVEHVWSDQDGGPESGRKAIHVHIYGLNRLLAQHGLQVRGSTSGGYRVLEVP
jgi:hypothetical protein